MINPLLPALLWSSEISLTRFNENLFGNIIPSIFILFLTKIMNIVLNDLDQYFSFLLSPFHSSSFFCDAQPLKLKSICIFANENASK